MQEFDVVIIGSGMGGLVCGNLLSQEGLRVCVLEKNRQFGGCLQTFVRNRIIFDSGVHYIGGLEKGQNLYQILKYMGVMEKLKLEKLDRDSFDKIIIDNDSIEYPFAQGYENFVKQLSVYFPGEEKAIQKYCDAMKEICSKFPLYNLTINGSLEEKFDTMNIGAMDFIETLTPNVKLQEILAGNNLLYAGCQETPFYIHALIVNSYIESSYKCINGGSQLAKIMVQNIRANGGEIVRNCEVKKIHADGDKAVYVETVKGEKILAKNFISNVHPAKTLEMIDSSHIRNAYRKRLKELKNTVSSFCVHIVLKEKSLKYFNNNFYYFKQGQVWTIADYTQDNWPLGYALFFTHSSEAKDWADSMTIFSYMRYEEMEPWKDTFNTVSDPGDRGNGYEDFKKRKAEKLMDVVEERFPGIKDCVESYYTTTPLSYRDYIGTDDGSLYGISRDYRDSLKTFISSRTKLKNLFLTGQNLNVHGILGTAIGGLLTCILLLGDDKIVERIRNA
ncbi:MAG: NAD(P)/FAD-dependent oxidoreductase [Bacteroidetes bacterium]|nr:NAD(P)/FAD-dependent oxidoreductase [Bacteroidota bacterium]MBS1737883.1 NAD(P)/FAD-dependent oxidoreductase [Bacteroidota bacterium]